VGKVSAINSRTKGANGELEFARCIHDELGIRLVRNLEQTRSGGYDLVPHPDESGPVVDVLHVLAFEVKRYRRATNGLITAWWHQTRIQAKDSRRVPVLAYREDRGVWKVICPTYLLNQDLQLGHGLQWCATLSVECFCSVVRELAAGGFERRCDNE